MNGTLTERRISSAALAVLTTVEDAYETYFNESADEQFFVELQAAYIEFNKLCAKRPIKPNEIATAKRVFEDMCRALMRAAKKRQRK